MSFTPVPPRSRPRDEERRTRKPLTPFDRCKGFLLLGIAWFLGVWNEASRYIDPDWQDAGAQFAGTGPGRVITVLLAAEVIRQMHFILAEHSAGYHRAWTGLFAGTGRAVNAVSPWTRFRLSRLAKWLTASYLAASLVGSIVGLSPLGTVVAAPTLLARNGQTLFQNMVYLAIAVLQFVAIFWFLSRGGVEVYMPDDIKTRFSDVWGQDQVLDRIRENVLFLENPEEIEARGGYVPGGVLLWGPPGTGKTLIAEAVAGETGRPFVFVDPGAFINMFMGIGVLKVRGLFRKLRKLALRHGGVIVFFDEADTLGNRGGNVAKSRRTAKVTPGDPETRPATPAACNGPAYVSDVSRAELADDARKLIVPGGTGRSMDGTLQALLSEIQGLSKPRGFFNRVVRRALGMRPKNPPRYRILIMMASNMPDSLDPALLRPGRIDRIYRVGYPTKDGRVETYRNYLRRVDHDLTDDQIGRLATVSPYATGATIKDTVNEALVLAIRDGRDIVSYADLVKAKALKQHGLPDGGGYVDRERHSVAIHEACHAVAMYTLLHTSTIDVATIERRGDVGGFVAPIPLEDRFVQWMSEIDVDVTTYLASLAGERLFYGDHTQGVGGDLAAATSLVTRSILSHGMGDQIRALNAAVLDNSGLTSSYGMPLMTGASWEGQVGAQVEKRLQGLYRRAEDLLKANRRHVLAVAHALEVHKTISGDDVAAVIEGRVGPLVDGRAYADPDFQAELEQYHASAQAAHQVRHERPPQLPVLPAAGA